MGATTSCHSCSAGTPLSLSQADFHAPIMSRSIAVMTPIESSTERFSNYVDIWKEEIQSLPPPSQGLWQIIIAKSEEEEGGFISASRLSRSLPRPSSCDRPTPLETTLLERLSYYQRIGCSISVQTVHPSLIHNTRGIHPTLISHNATLPHNSKSSRNSISVTLPSLKYPSSATSSDDGSSALAGKHFFSVSIKGRSSLSSYGLLSKDDSISDSSAHLTHTDGCYYFSTEALKDRNLWLKILKRFLGQEVLQCPRQANSLHLWIQELKQAQSKKRYFCQVMLDGVVTTQTSSKMMGDMLLWAEEFHFEDLYDVKNVSIHVYCEGNPKKKKQKTTLLGCVNINTQELMVREQDRWHYVISSETLSPSPDCDIINGSKMGLSPVKKPSSSQHSSSPVSPSPSTNNPLLHGLNTSTPLLRLKARWRSIKVAPLKEYAVLRQFLSKHAVAFAQELEQATIPTVSPKTQEELATNLVRVLHCDNNALEYLTQMILLEVEKMKEENLTLRGNSMATKSIEEYLRLLSDKYLFVILHEFVHLVTQSNEDCEVDPVRILNNCTPHSYANGSRLSNPSNHSSGYFSSPPSSSALDSNATNTWLDQEMVAHRRALIKLVESVWNKIWTSHAHVPKELREVFTALRERLKQQHQRPNNERVVDEQCFRVISACLFLRLLCPAILSPSLFGLLSHYPDSPHVNRTLTLVAKTIQSLANGSLFGQKENYMVFMNDFLHRNMPLMKTFLSTVSSSTPTDAQDATSPQNTLPSHAYLDRRYELACLYHQLSDLLRDIHSQKLSPTLLQLQEVLQSISDENSPEENSCCNSIFLPSHTSSARSLLYSNEYSPHEDPRSSLTSHSRDSKPTKQTPPVFENDYDEPYNELPCETPSPTPRSLFFDKSNETNRETCYKNLSWNDVCTAPRSMFTASQQEKIEEAWHLVLKTATAACDESNEASLLKRSASTQLYPWMASHTTSQSKTSTSQNPLSGTLPSFLQDTSLAPPTASNSTWSYTPPTQLPLPNDREVELHPRRGREGGVRSYVESNKHEQVIHDIAELRQRWRGDTRRLDETGSY